MVQCLRVHSSTKVLEKDGDSVGQEKEEEGRDRGMFGIVAVAKCDLRWKGL